VVENNFSPLVGSTIPDFPTTIDAWTNWVNSNGGINGHPVKVIQKNDNNDIAQAAAAATALAADKSVLVILDSDQGGLDSSWQAVADRAQVPVICGAASGSGAACSSDANFFPSGTTVLTSIWGQSKAAALAGAKDYGLFDCTEPSCAPAAPLEKKAALQNGLTYGYETTANPTAPDYTAQCLAAKEAKVDALFAVVGPRVASDCLRQGYSPIWIESMGAYTASLRENPNFKYVTGDVGDFPWFLDTSPATHDFHQVMSKYSPNFDSFGSPYNATATRAGLQLFAAAAAHVPDNPTRQDIYDGIYALPPNFTLNGLIPPETITKGKPTLNSCMFVVDIKNAQYSAPYGLKTFCQQPSTSTGT
jgi:branched-chain amino acid transport system substrate-binding protein